MLWNEKSPSHAKQLASCVYVLTAMIIRCNYILCKPRNNFTMKASRSTVFMHMHRNSPQPRYIFLSFCMQTYNQLHCLIGQWTTLIYTLIFLGGCVMHRLVVPVLKCPHCNLCNLLWNCCNLCDEWDIEMDTWQKWLNSSLTQDSYSKMREGSVISPDITVESQEVDQVTLL